MPVTSPCGFTCVLGTSVPRVRQHTNPPFIFCASWLCPAAVPAPWVPRLARPGSAVIKTPGVWGGARSRREALCLGGADRWRLVTMQVRGRLCRGLGRGVTCSFTVPWFWCHRAGTRPSQIIAHPPASPPVHLHPTPSFLCFCCESISANEQNKCCLFVLTITVQI